MLRVTEHLYGGTIHGKPLIEVKGLRAQRLISKEDIDELIHPKAKCCNGNCISLWKDDLPDDELRAIITTERNAFAKMSEPVRRLHYMTFLKQLLVPIYATVSTNKKVLTGEEGWYRNAGTTWHAGW